MYCLQLSETRNPASQASPERVLSLVTLSLEIRLGIATSPVMSAGMCALMPRSIRSVQIKVIPMVVKSLPLRVGVSRTVLISLSLVSLAK